MSNQPQPPGKFIFILIIVWAIVLTSCFVNRPGVLRLIDEAIAAPDIAVGICSAATKAGFLKVVNSIVGPERLARLDVIMAGDDVTRKKPDPLIYNLAREKVNLPSSKCVVIEDSLVGLRAAMGADMPCVITPCPSSDVPDFKAHGAKAVMDVNVGLGDGSNEVVTLAKLFPPGAEAPNFDFGGRVRVEWCRFVFFFGRRPTVVRSGGAGDAGDEGRGWGRVRSRSVRRRR